MTDSFITDFSRAWRGLPHDESGAVAGSVPPDWWVEAYYRSIKRQEQQKDSITAANCTFDVDENGFVHIRQGSSVIQIRPEDRLAFAGALFRLPSRGGPYPAPGVASSGQSSSRIHPQIKDDRPQIVANRKRNEETMALALKNQAEAQDRLGKDQQRNRKERLRQEMGY